MKRFNITVVKPTIYKLKVDAETFEDAEKYIRNRSETINYCGVGSYSVKTGELTITQNGEAKVIPTAYNVRISRELYKYITVETEDEKEALDKAMDILEGMDNDEFITSNDRVKVDEVIYGEEKNATIGEETNKD